MSVKKCIYSDMFICGYLYGAQKVSLYKADKRTLLQFFWSKEAAFYTM